MQIELRHGNLEISDALEVFVRLHVGRALRPFQENVERVEVRMQDLNGPRGGMDTRCSVIVELAGSNRALVVKSTSTDAYEAVRAACGRLGESVSRSLGRSRRLDRFAAPASRGAAADLHH